MQRAEEEISMIVVRDVFHVDPEQMKNAKEGLAQVREINKRLGYPTMRVLTDLIGDYYTIVLESEFAGLGEYESAIQRVLADAAWQKAYAPFRKMIRSGKREIYSVME
jgi:hypothetical protein